MFPTKEIKGLVSYEDHNMSDVGGEDPTSAHIWFSVEKVFMPFKSSAEGRPTNENFVYLNWRYELGRSSGRKRISDVVKYNETLKKWEIVLLAPEGQSHIKAYPDAWNAFYDGTSESELGTSLELLFTYDPARVDAYKQVHIHTIEQLAKLSEADASRVCMGSLDDWRKAQRYVENLNKAVTGVQLNGHIKALESENASLKSQLSDLNNKFSELIERFEKASALQSAMRSVASSVSVDASPRKRGRPSKIRDASEIVTRDDLGEGAVIGDLTMGAGE